MRLVFFHALPFGGEMWADEVRGFGPDALAPTLYDEGDSLTDWATAALRLIGEELCIAIGCSVGGSCAIELARLAPNQVAGLVLVGAKAGVRPEPALRDAAIAHVDANGIESAFEEFWQGLFAPDSSTVTIDAARRLALLVEPQALARGLRAFHERRDNSEFAAGWTKPLVGVSGVHDHSPTPATVAALATGPNRRFHLVEGSGHYVNLEQPAVFRSILSASIEWITAAAQTC